jgi:hypothetical protein
MRRAVSQSSLVVSGPVPWRGPQEVSPAKLFEYIQLLEKKCEENPKSADLRTCLGIAQAINSDVYRAMESLETAIRLDERHFFARFKYAELFCRLQILVRAEEETIKALKLARTAWEVSMAGRQLQQIRYLIREGSQKTTWKTPLINPVVALVLFLVFFIVAAGLLWLSWNKKGGPGI